MTAHSAIKGIPRKPMRLQLRGDRKKVKPVKINKRRAKKW